MPNSNPDTLPENFDFQSGKAPQAAQPAQKANNPDTLPENFDFSGGSSNQSDTGEVKNDVGNTVIVPKEPGTFLHPYGEESFSDTMKRAANYGKTVTPEQISRETATMPAKVAQTVAAAPLIGAGGVLGADVLGSALGGAANVVKNIPSAASKVAETVRNIPSAALKEFQTQPIATTYRVGMGLGIPLGFLAWLKHYEGGK
jgi:hypothetical protein